MPGWMLKLFLGEVATVVIHGRRVLPAKALEPGYHFAYAHAEEALSNLLK
jgi:NAD dependent epimerase/dehydratase family enzyme